MSMNTMPQGGKQEKARFIDILTLVGLVKTRGKMHDFDALFALFAFVVYEPLLVY